MSQTVAGRFEHMSDDGNFCYLYTCACGENFRESTPEVSAPAICHSCYRGKRSGENFRKVENSKRRQRHQSEAT